MQMSSSNVNLNMEHSCKCGVGIGVFLLKQSHYYVCSNVSPLQAVSNPALVFLW